MRPVAGRDRMTSIAGTHEASVLMLLVALTGAVRAESPPESRITLEVDLGEDFGQSYGTLFEVTDKAGKVVAGAGFLNAYNTQDRTDRRLLQVYVKVNDPSGFTPQRLPRPTTDSGTYLYGFANQLFAKTRSAARDNKQRVWNASKNEWIIDDKTIPFNVAVGKGVLASTQREVTFDGQTILELPAEQGNLAEPYYALGTLVARRHRAASHPPINELIAATWKLGAERLEPEAGIRLPLTTATEFIYAYGQLREEIVAVSNMGGVHVFNGKWRTLREPVPNVSYQVYSILNYKDRLLLGHYPTGELYEYDGKELRLKKGWPPVMPGVSTAAREAQTLALYGGELYVGVWPWGEVWRMDPETEEWTFLGRMFTHPEPTKDTTHPYEKETQAVDPVLNRWGQRVTSLVPWGDSLYIATSSKGGNPYEPKFPFLADGKSDEYGAVYRFKKPGCLAVPFAWKDGPTTLEVRWTSNELTVLQDRREIGNTVWRNAVPFETPLRVKWREGIFGELQGNIGTTTERISTETAIPATIKPERFVAAYVDLTKIVDQRKPVFERKRQIDSMLDRFKASGFTTAFPYANTTSGEVLYLSYINTRQRMPDWNPLGYFLSAARKREIAVWPAFCVLACGHFEPKGILLDRPDLALRQLDGKPWGFLSPAHPKARELIVEQLREIMEYAPDGLMLDYARYFNRPWTFDVETETQLEAELLKFGVDTEKERSTYRQRFAEKKLTELIAEIRKAADFSMPEGQIGIYTWGPHVAKNHQVAQAWPEWIKQGLIDHVDVSGYCYPANYGDRYLDVFRDRLRDARVLANGAHVSATIGVHTSHGRIESAEAIEAYFGAARAAAVNGLSIFTWSSFEPFANDLNERHAFDRFFDKNADEP